MRKILVVATLFLLTACGDEVVIQSNEQQNNKTLQKEIEQKLKEDEAITKANIISVNDEWLITYEMNPLEKWRKKKHLNSLKKSIEELDSSQKFTISNDFKLFLESEKLLEKRDEKKIKKRMKELKKLMEEET